jgi:hypothetical protein
MDEMDRLLVLSGPTENYPHGVLGDQVEATRITLIETSPEPQLVRHIQLAANQVIEGTAPIWSDLDGDDRREIIVTISDLELGSGIAIFSEDGQRIAQGPFIGTPFRWRHQVAVANFSPASEIELAVVRTPHLAGTIEFYQLHNGELKIVAEYQGITSHGLGSRNLDQAAAGDFDGNGLSEILVLRPDLQEYIAVRRTNEGAEAAWHLPLDGTATTNLAGTTLPDGRIALGAGTSGGKLRIWLPLQ